MRYLVTSLIAFSILLSLNAQQKILHCGEFIDVKAKKVLTEVSILVENDRIIGVEKGYVQSVNADIIDLRNKTVMPGLMDMHVHLEGEVDKDEYLSEFTNNPADIAFEAVGYAHKTLMAGFTTVRDLGGSGINISLRNAINNGKLAGPRIYTAGKIISITGGHGDPTNGYRKDLMGNPGPDEGVANGKEECIQAVRQQIKNGADLIKITATAGVLSMAKNGSAPQFTQEEVDAIVATATDAGVHVAAHAHGVEGMLRAVRGGVKSIEHGTFMNEEVMVLMKSKGTYYVPTLTAGRSVADSAKIPHFYPELIQPKAISIGPQLQANFSKAHKYGIKIAFGSDAGVFAHGKNAMEFIYMTEGGMTMMEAICAATITNANLLGIEKDLGSIEKGKIADIIAVSGDPMNNPARMLEVEFVMKEGKIYKK